MGEGGAEIITFSVDDALLTLGFGKYQYGVLAYAALAWVSEAMEMMLLSFIGPVVKRIWRLSAKEQSLITSVVFIGMLVGAYTWGVIADKYGRRWEHFLHSNLCFNCLFNTTF